MKSVVLYTRARCHLCDVMKQQLDVVREKIPFALTVLDIDADAELRRLYNEEVPVLVVEGEKIAKYRLDEEMLLRRLRAEPAA